MVISAFTRRGRRHSVRHPPPLVLNLVTCTIQDGHGFVLPQAIHAIDQGSYDLMLLTDTKILDSVYCHKPQGHDFVCSGATFFMARGSQGGFLLVSRELLEGWIFESTLSHKPNVVICDFVAGYQRTPLIGVYLPPSTLDHLPDLNEALNRFPGRDPVILGYLNTDISLLRNPWDQQVAGFLASFGLVDLLGNFQQRLRYLHFQTWWQVGQVRVLRLWCDCVLGSDQWMFKTIGILQARLLQ